MGATSYSRFLPISQFLTKNDQNCTWKSLDMSHNIVFGEICHKYIHMMGWKGQTSKEIVSCGNSISLSSCCEQAAAGMLRAFPVHFVPLQSKSTQCNVHDSHAATENYMKCCFSYESKCWAIALNTGVISSRSLLLCAKKHISGHKDNGSHNLTSNFLLTIHIQTAIWTLLKHVPQLEICQKCVW